LIDKEGDVVAHRKEKRKPPPHGRRYGSNGPILVATMSSLLEHLRHSDFLYYSNSAAVKGINNVPPRPQEIKT